MAHKYKNGKWITDITIGGKRHRKIFSEKKYALMYEQDLVKQHDRKTVGLSQDDSTELEKIIQNYKKHIQLYKSDSQIEHEKYCLLSFERFLEKKNILLYSDIEKNTWELFAKYRKDMTSTRNKTVSNKTVNNELQVINRMFSWAESNDIVSENKFKSYQKLKVDKPKMPAYLTPEQIKKMEEFMLGDTHFKRFHNIFYVLVRTGLRCNEMCTLEFKDVNFDKKQIVLDPRNTKSSEARIVPINEEIIAVIKSQLDEARLFGMKRVFFSKNGTNLDRQNVSRSFRRILKRCEAIGIIEDAKELNVHSLRKTYISNMVMAGVDPQKIMRVVGHKDWQTMKRYLHLAPDFGNDIVSRLTY